MLTGPTFVAVALDLAWYRNGNGQKVSVEAGKEPLLQGGDNPGRAIVRSSGQSIPNLPAIYLLTTKPQDAAAGTVCWAGLQRELEQLRVGGGAEGKNHRVDPKFAS